MICIQTNHLFCPVFPCLSLYLSDNDPNKPHTTDEPPSRTFVAILAIHLGTYSQVPRGNMESHAPIDVIVKRLDFLGETVDGGNPKQPPPGI